MSDAATQTALLQIFDRLGNIDGRMSGIEDRLDAGSRRHEEFSQQIAELDAKVEPVTALKTTVEGMQPIVENYQRATWVGAGIMLAFGAVCGFVGFFWSEFRTLITIALGGKH